MYGTTTAADATMNERYFSLYAKGKTPPGSSTPAAEARDAERGASSVECQASVENGGERKLQRR